MSDLKSKIPDLNEITSIAGKLFKDVKKSIAEIIADYKQKHPQKSESSTEAKESVDKPAGEPKKTKDEPLSAEKVADKKENPKKEDVQKEESAAKKEETSSDQDK